MSLLSFFSVSANKTKRMKKIERLMTSTSFTTVEKAIEHDSDLAQAFERLYETLCRVPRCAETLLEHQATSTDLKKISSRIQLAGYAYDENGDYLPVAIISFFRPLDYVLSNKDKIFNYGYREVREVTDAAIHMLNEYS